MNELFPVEIIGAEAMRAFGKKMGKWLKSGDVVALIGDLGAGKTHLTQGIALSKGYKGEVTSPTFALVNEYLGGEDGEVDVFHFDVYRLEDAEEMLEIGWEDYLDRDGVVVIEWADKFPELIPVGAWCVGIEHVVSREKQVDGSEAMLEGRRLVCEVLEDC
ncbi:MAG: tRNA (adenosine(37)-N6)-threonylcarbamoyltransferase complex ATPase subunit type 1 TsaE [Akkermansiaceae bacterium]